MQAQDVAQKIRDTVERWVEGKVDAKTFEAFLAKSNQELDQLMVEKERRDWEDLNWRTMY